MFKKLLLKLVFVGPEDWVRVLMLVAAIGLTALGLLSGLKSYKAVASGQSATATCTRLETERKINQESGYTTCHYFWARFKDETGSSHSVRFSNFFLSPVAKGDSVEVIYEEGNPENVFPSRFTSLWAGSIVYVAFGLFLGLCFYHIVKKPEVR